MDFCKSNGIFDTVKPFYYLSKAFGFTIFRIVDKKQSRIGVIDLIIFLVVPVFLGYYQVLDLLNYKDKSLNKSVTLDVGIKFALICEILMFIGAIIINALKRNDIFQLLLSIDDIDQSIAKIGNEMNHSLQKRNCIAFIAASCVVMLFQVIATAVVSIHAYHLTSFNLLVLIAYGVTLVCSFVYAAQFILVIYAINARFRAINNCFVKSFNTKLQSQQGTDVEMSSSEAIVVLNQIRIIYDQLCDIVSAINSCFSFQIMCSVGLSVVYITMCIFAFLRYALFTEGFMLIAILYLIWLGFHGILTTVVISSASSTIMEARFMDVLVFKSLNYTKSNTLIAKIGVFGDQLRLRSPSFHCGLFLFDWTLFFSIIGTVATYLIILVQFDLDYAE